MSIKKRENKSSLGPDEVWAEFGRHVKLSTRLLPAETELDVPSMVIEGNAASLKCLARVILAVAEDEDCGYGISPRGPGSSFFNKDAGLGIYLHRIPCVHKEIKKTE
jgi:hypothetical protein